MASDQQQSGQPEEVARVLRLAKFALERTNVSLLAWAESNHITNRDYGRNREVIRQIDVALVDFPPEPPLTPEEEAECAEILGRALETFGE